MLDELAVETVYVRVEKLAVIIRVKRSRMWARTERFGTDHDARVVMRWLKRCASRMPVLPVDDPVIDYSDTHTEDFMRGYARFGAYVRVLVDPPAFVPPDLRVAPGVGTVRFPVMPQLTAFR